MKSFLSGLLNAQDKVSPGPATSDLIKGLLEKSTALKAEIAAAPENSEQRTIKIKELLDLYLQSIEDALTDAPEDVRRLLRLLCYTQMAFDRSLIAAQGVDVSKIKFIPLVK